MENRSPIPFRRKLMLGALAVGVGLSLAAIAVSFAINALGTPQVVQQSSLEIPEDSANTQEAAQRTAGDSEQTQQSSLQIPADFTVVQEITHEVQLVGIVPSPRIVRLDDPGDSLQLSVQGYYSDGTLGELEDANGKTLTYTSSDPLAAQVSDDGVVTALEKGGADIEVGYVGFTAMVPVLVWGEVRRIPTIKPVPATRSRR